MTSTDTHFPFAPPDPPSRAPSSEFTDRDVGAAIQYIADSHPYGLSPDEFELAMEPLVLGLDSTATYVAKRTVLYSLDEWLQDSYWEALIEENAAGPACQASDDESLADNHELVCGAAADIPQGTALKLQLAAIAGDEPATSFFEIRSFDRTMKPSRRSWAPVEELDRAAADVAKLAGDLNVFIGVAPRARKDGTARAVERVWVLWADLDGKDALDRLDRFQPAPSIVVSTGSEDHAHAYWSLHKPIPPAWAQRANRRLALALGGDSNATDAARVLRPVGTLNHKHQPPRPVICTRLELDVFVVGQVVGGLADDRDYLAPLRPARDLPMIEPSRRLGGLARTVKEAPEGDRNTLLHWAACRVGEDAELDDWSAHEALRLAGIDAGLGKMEVERTLQSGLDTGRAAA